MKVVEGLAYEGHLGYTIGDLDYCVQNAGWMEQAQPDMILLLTGIDDASWFDPPEDMLKSLEKLLGSIYEKMPETTEVIIAQYPPTRDEEYDGWKPDSTVNQKQILAEYNAGIPGVVEKLQVDGKHVNFVNMDNVFQSADEYDQIGFQRPARRRSSRRRASARGRRVAHVARGAEGAEGGAAGKPKKGAKVTAAAAEAERPSEPPRPPRLRQHYREQVVPALMQRFGYKNRMQVPRLEKIVVNMGMGDAISNSKLLEAAVADMTQITGQKPVVTHAKKSIANFKLREGMPISAAG